LLIKALSHFGWEFFYFLFYLFAAFLFGTAQPVGQALGLCTFKTWEIIFLQIWA
jgi:hypothetical protein